MKVKIKYYPGREEELNLFDYIINRLERDNEDGHLEALEGTIKKTSEAVSRLLTLLAEKKIINPTELMTILDSYETITFEEKNDFRIL